MTIKKEALIVEHLNLLPKQGLEPFIYTDILAEYAGNHQVTCFHYWTMKNQLILGMQDTRVTDLTSGISSVLANNYQPIVRNSGGLAVVADEGVLNFSMIMPQPKEKNNLSINHGYELMKEMIESALSDFNCQIDAFEVSDSYCPGEFDLSINGKKFAGISQRRIKQGIGVMIYLSVTGNQQKRGELVKEFYQTSLGENFGKNNFPPVNPDSMANLSDLLETELTVSEMIVRLNHAIKKQFDLKQQTQDNFDVFLTTKEFNLSFNHQQDRMLQRNEIINWEVLQE